MSLAHPFQFLLLNSSCYASAHLRHLLIHNSGSSLVHPLTQTSPLYTQTFFYFLFLTPNCNFESHNTIYVIPFHTLLMVFGPPGKWETLSLPRQSVIYSAGDIFSAQRKPEVMLFQYKATHTLGKWIVQHCILIRIAKYGNWPVFYLHFGVFFFFYWIEWTVARHVNTAGSKVWDWGYDVEETNPSPFRLLTLPGEQPRQPGHWPIWSSS